MFVSRIGIGFVAALAGMMFVGCYTKPSTSKTTPAAVSDDHSGWWCGEHGVPEGECTQCNSKLAADYQKKGDWCQEHNRADSQCFVCHPDFEAKFAARYEAKYGTKPPKIGEASHGHEHAHEHSEPKS